MPQIDLETIPFRDHEDAIGNLIRELWKEEHLRRPPYEKVEQIVSILEGRCMGEWKNFLRFFRKCRRIHSQSLYYNESHFTL